jgi:hypothetical protein
VTPAIAGALKLAVFVGGGRREEARAPGHGDAGVAGELHAAKGDLIFSLSVSPALRPYVVI